MAAENRDQLANLTCHSFFLLHINRLFLSASYPMCASPHLRAAAQPAPSAALFFLLASLSHVENACVHPDELFLGSTNFSASVFASVKLGRCPIHTYYEQGASSGWKCGWQQEREREGELSHIHTCILHSLLRRVFPCSTDRGECSSHIATRCCRHPWFRLCTSAVRLSVRACVCESPGAPASRHACAGFTEEKINACNPNEKKGRERERERK